MYLFFFSCEASEWNGIFIFVLLIAIKNVQIRLPVNLIVQLVAFVILEPSRYGRVL